MSARIMNFTHQLNNSTNKQILITVNYHSRAIQHRMNLFLEV